MLLTWFPWARRNLMPFKEAIATSSLRWKETPLLPWKLSRLMAGQKVEHHQRHKGIQNGGGLKGGKGLITNLFTRLRALIRLNSLRRHKGSYLSNMLSKLLSTSLGSRMFATKTTPYIVSTSWVRTDVGYCSPLHPYKKRPLIPPPPTYTYGRSLQNIFSKLKGRTNET